MHLPGPDATRVPSSHSDGQPKAPWVNGSRGQKPIQRLKAVAALAGVDDASFQMFRRSWATHAEAVMGPAMIARILPHTTTRTSEEHYRQADVTNMQAAVRDFRF